MAIDVPPCGPETDAVLEWAARLIEDLHLSDIGGIAARKKRDREDAQVRIAAIERTRRDCARHIRAFKSRTDLSTEAVLRRISELNPNSRHDFELIEAWPLAWKGLVKIEANINVASNVVPPETKYRITLTDKGRALLRDSADQAA